MRPLRSLLLLTALAAAVACKESAYDAGEGEYSLMRADFIEAHTGGNRHLASAVTDDGDSLLPAEPFKASWMGTADTTYRALVYYNPAPDAGADRIQVVSMTRVPTASMRPRSRFEKGFPTDPVGFESAWLSKNRRYLNLGLMLKSGSAEGLDDAAHQLGFVADTVTTATAMTIRLQLYHNQAGIPEYYSQHAYVSLPIHGCRADTIKLTLNSYAGPVSKVFVLKQE